MSWLLRFALVAVVIGLGRGAGWRWAGAILVALIAVPLAEIAWRFLLLAIFARVDRRRGLAVREWTAIRILGNCAESADKHNFNRFTMTRMKRTDAATLIGYATVLVNLYMTDRLGANPGDAQVDRLAAECAPAWRWVMPRDAAMLTRLLHEARDYRRDGFPDPSWDNCRAMAAAAGVLRPPRKARSKGIRFKVAAQYDEARASAARTPSDG